VNTGRDRETFPRPGLRYGHHRDGHHLTCGIAYELENAYHAGALHVLDWAGHGLSGEETHYIAGRATAYGDAMDTALRTGRGPAAAGKPMLLAAGKEPLLDFERIYPSSDERLGHPIIRGIAFEAETAYLQGAVAALGWVGIETTKMTEEQRQYLYRRARAYGDWVHDVYVAPKERQT